MRVYCEVMEQGDGIRWRIIAETPSGYFEGAWQYNYANFAELEAPTGENGKVEHWIAGTRHWSDTDKTIGGFPEFTPITIGANVGQEYKKMEEPKKIVFKPCPECEGKKTGCGCLTCGGIGHVIG